MAGPESVASQFLQIRSSDCGSKEIEVGVHYSKTRVAAANTPRNRCQEGRCEWGPRVPECECPETIE
jgi:hypothetical protein